MPSRPLRNSQIPVTDPVAGLKISEIFYSLQGEGLTAGLPTVFVRLTGCPLRCVYCDTAYAFAGGERLSLEEILRRVAAYPCMRVCVTGGEPLAQPNCLALLRLLVERGYAVSLETSGALPVADVPEAVSKVMDLKTPSSGEADKNLWENLDRLSERDQLKIVIADRQDYDWAAAKVRRYDLHKRCAVVWFSPTFAAGDAVQSPPIAADLAQWILQDALPVRLQLQLHKIIWADARGK